MLFPKNVKRVISYIGFKNNRYNNKIKSRFFTSKNLVTKQNKRWKPRDNK